MAYSEVFLQQFIDMYVIDMDIRLSQIQYNNQNDTLSKVFCAIRVPARFGEPSEQKDPMR